MSVPVVFFNASVVLAALRSKSGGSAKLINWGSQGRINGVISEIVLDEIRRHLSKIKVSRRHLRNCLLAFNKIYPAPGLKSVDKLSKTVADPGDAHLLASCQDIKADYLVSLDKKHILSLKTRVKRPRIVNPKELIERLG